VLRLSEGFQLLAFKPAESVEGWLVRLQNTGRRGRAAVAEFLGKRIPLGRIGGGGIRTVILQPANGAWNVAVVNAVEEPVLENTERGCAAPRPSL
jgi:hypothetical protein